MAASLFHCGFAGSLRYATESEPLTYGAPAAPTATFMNAAVAATELR